MNFAHLYYFKTLAETKNRRQTAQSLSITQPTLSQAISKLEAELGVALFKKSRSGVYLTEEGAAFYQYVATSLKFLDNGVSFIQKKKSDQVRTINIGAVFSAQNQDWSKILYEFRRITHGNIQLNIIQSTTPDLLNRLKNGTVDVAFAGPVGEDPELIFYPVWTQSVALLANHDHPLSKRSSISLTELKDQHIVSYSLQGPLGPSVTALLQDHDLPVECLYSDEITLASIVSANPDVLAIACHSWLLDAYQHELVCLPIDEAPNEFRQLYLCYCSNIERTETINTFIQITKSLW